MKGYNKKWKHRSLFLITGLCLALIGCGASKNGGEMTAESAAATADYAATDSFAGDAGLYMEPEMESYDAAAEAPAAVAEEAVAEEAYETENGAGSPQENKDLGETVASNRKLIRRVDMSVETREFSQLVQNIEKKVNELGGYMESGSVYGGGYSGDDLKSADFKVRVPVDKLDDMINAVSQSANVVSRSESATDVTLSYVDTESRKEAYEIEYERLMALLQKAEDIDTIVALEARLTDVRYEIQNLESQLRTYDNLVDYATITISVVEVEVYTPAVVEKKSDWERMTEGFVTSFREIGLGLKNFGIDFVIALPYLIVWAVFVGVIALIVCLIVKHSKKKKEKTNQKEAAADNKKDAEKNTEQKAEQDTEQK